MKVLKYIVLFSAFIGGFISLFHPESSLITDLSAWFALLLVLALIIISIYRDCTVRQHNIKKAQKKLYAEAESAKFRFKNNPMVQEFLQIFYQGINSCNHAEIYEDKFHFNKNDYYYSNYGYDKLDIPSTRALAIYLGHYFPIADGKYLIKELTHCGGSGNRHYYETPGGHLDSSLDYWEVEIGYSVTITELQGKKWFTQKGKFGFLQQGEWLSESEIQEKTKKW